MGPADRMNAWIEMTVQRDQMMAYLFLLALMVFAFWRLAFAGAGRQKARIVAYGLLCVGFFATLVIGWMLRRLS